MQHPALWQRHMELFLQVPPYSECVDWGTSSNIADLILKGDYTSDQLEPLAQDPLHFLHKHTTLHAIDNTIPVSDLIAK